MIWTPRAALAGWNFYDFWPMTPLWQDFLFGHFDVPIGTIFTMPCMILHSWEHLNGCLYGDALIIYSIGHLMMCLSGITYLPMGLLSIWTPLWVSIWHIYTALDEFIQSLGALGWFFIWTPLWVSIWHTYHALGWFFIILGAPHDVPIWAIPAHDWLFYSLEHLMMCLFDTEMCQEHTYLCPGWYYFIWGALRCAYWHYLSAHGIIIHLGALQMCLLGILLNARGWYYQFGHRYGCLYGIFTLPWMNLFNLWGTSMCLLGQSLPCPVWYFILGAPIWVPLDDSSLFWGHLNVCPGFYSILEHLYGCQDHTYLCPWMILHLDTAMGVYMAYLHCPGWIYSIFGALPCAYWHYLSAHGIIINLDTAMGVDMAYFTMPLDDSSLFWGHLMMCLSWHYLSVP
jgi:hypothetical protein